MSDPCDELLDEILVDAYGIAEQLTAFEEAFNQRARLPFPARIVGTPVEVIAVESEGHDWGRLTAVCTRDGQIHRVALADLTPGPVTLETSLLLEAHRRWLGLPPGEPDVHVAASPPWSYRPVASKASNLKQPLALQAMGMWDPGEQYWGEPGTEIHPLYQQIIAAGARPEFEMEQIIPGEDPDDWDSDPILEAAGLHGAGYHREAERILEDLIATDERCIDAWVHLGNIALRTKGPKAALGFYDTAVAVGELSLPDRFNGVLPRGFVDNRPFHRALHGLGLCAWRQRRWNDSEEIFTNLLWVDGAQTWGALECLVAVISRERWSDD